SANADASLSRSGTAGNSPALPRPSARPRQTPARSQPPYPKTRSSPRSPARTRSSRASADPPATPPAHTYDAPPPTPPRTPPPTLMPVRPPSQVRHDPNQRRRPHRLGHVHLEPARQRLRPVLSPRERRQRRRRNRTPLLRFARPDLPDQLIPVFPRHPDVRQQ